MEERTVHCERSLLLLSRLYVRTSLQIVPVELEFAKPLFDPDPVGGVGSDQCRLNDGQELVIGMLGQRLHEGKHFNTVLAGDEPLVEPLL